MAHQKSLIGSWELYTARIDYTTEVDSMLKYHKKFTSMGYRILIYRYETHLQYDLYRIEVQINSVHCNERKCNLQGKNDLSKFGPTIPSINWSRKWSYILQYLPFINKKDIYPTRILHISTMKINERSFFEHGFIKQNHIPHIS